MTDFRRACRRAWAARATITAMSRDRTRWYLDPVVLAWVHLGHAAFWILFLIPLFLWWSQSIALLQFISVWALVTSGLGGAQAALAQREARENGES